MKIPKQRYKDLELYPLSNQNTMTGQKGGGKTTLSMLYIIQYLSVGKVVFCNFRLMGGWYIAAARVIAGGAARFRALSPSRQRELVKDVRSRCFRFDDWDDLYRVKPRRRVGENPEDRFLCVYDEGSIRLNARSYSERQSRSKARYGTPVRETQFFSQGRKLGFTILVISQSEQSLDNQFRQQAGYRIHLRHLKNTGYMGIKLPVNKMLAIYHWGETKTVMKRKLFGYPQWLSNYYDSWELFDSTTQHGLRYQFDPDYPIGRVSDLRRDRPLLHLVADVPGESSSPELATGEGARGQTDNLRTGPATPLPFEVGEQVSQDTLAPWERVVGAPLLGGVAQNA